MSGVVQVLFTSHILSQVSLSFVARKGAQTSQTYEEAKWDATGVGIPADVWLNGLHCPAHRFPHSDEQPEDLASREDGSRYKKR
jgi:hypothetical protein